MSRRWLVVSLLLVPVLLVTSLVATGRWPRSRAPQAPLLAVARVTAPPPGPTVRAVEVRRGDSLVSALARERVDARLAAEIAAALIAAGAEPRRVRPGDALTITRDPAGRTTAVRYAPTPWLAFDASSSGSGWTGRRSAARPEIRVAAIRGTVSRSLFDAVEDARESPPLALALVEIFSSDFDFTADTRAGDRFRLLVEKRYAGERFVEYGQILVAQYATGDRTLTGVGWTSAARAARHGYYDPAGRSLRKSFLKSPLEFTRITSGFTYARPHPILGGVRPHLAVDYAAPTGTPVRAVALGVVAHAGWDGGNGISVRLRHRSGFETMYNHLSRLGSGVRAGSRVSQRQVIGYVGATGLATGPHLDYRVARHGQLVNPLSEKFIPGEPIAAAERPEFMRRARALVERLQHDVPF